MKFLEKSGLFFSVIIILVLLLVIVFAKHGILDYKELRLKETQVFEQTDQIIQKNRNLEVEINKLKTDINYIKHVAKHEYGMAEEDEIIFKDELEK